MLLRFPDLHHTFGSRRITDVSMQFLLIGALLMVGTTTMVYAYSTVN